MRIRLWVISFFLVILPAQVPASESGTIDHVTLGTATKGGGFQLFGQNLIEVINATEPTLRVTEVPTKGSKENIPFLEQGKIQLGLVEGNAAREALEGVGRAPADLQVLSVMYPNPGMFVVRGDSPYKTIDDLKGKPIAFGTKESGLRILASDVLDGLGLKPDVNFKQIILEKAAQGPKLVLDAKAEALWGAGIGWPGFVEVAESVHGARFIAPSAEQIQQILKKHPHLIPMSVPANTYKGQLQQIDSVGLWSVILVRSDVSEEVVYRLVRSIDLGGEKLVKRLEQGRYTTAQNTLRYISPSRIHPGALRYYKEAGLINN